MRTRFSPTTVLAVVVLIACMIPLGGCGYLGSTKAVKESRKFYFSHVNTPAKLDLDDPNVLKGADSALVSRLMNIDSQLTSLERALNSLGTNVDQATVETFMRRFPWLSNLVLLDSTGNIMASAPAVPLKRLDFTPLLEPAPKAGLRDLRVHVQDTAMGPEVLVARPFYVGQELNSMMAVTFDFRALMPYTTDPDTLTVRTADILLWEGGQAGSAGAGVDWDNMLRNRSFGNDSGSTWLARYIGFVPFVFATPSR